MNKVIINDCRDSNASGRQQVRLNVLVPGQTTFIGVENDIEAAGNLIDSLDALAGTEGLILVNVAPRNGAAKKFQNGTPFGYFFYKGAVVISSVSGYTLSLVKKLELVSEIKVFSPKTIFDELGILEKQDTQFRSFELTPEIAHALLSGKELSAESLLIDEVPDMPDCVWLEDCFFNLKTTLLEPPGEPFFIGDKVINLYPRLKDIPDKQAGLVVGSSGLGDRRFLEIMVNGGKAAELFNLKVGDLI